MRRSVEVGLVLLGWAVVVALAALVAWFFFNLQRWSV